LGKHCYALAEEAEKTFSATAAFISISLDEHSFSAYFESLSVLQGNMGILMTQKGISRYRCLADGEWHQFDLSDLRNTY
jgi:hypothetical protein